MPMTTDWAFGAAMRKYARPVGSTIGYWYPGALSGDGLASAAGCVLGRVVAGAAAGWASAVAPQRSKQQMRADVMRAGIMGRISFGPVFLRCAQAKTFVFHA